MSFTDPASFDAYIDDAIRHVESYLPCIVEPVVSSRSAYEQFIKGVKTFEPSQHSAWLWFNLIAHSVRNNMRFVVSIDIGEDHPQYSFVDFMRKYSPHVVAVVLGLATMHAEF